MSTDPFDIYVFPELQPQRHLDSPSRARIDYMNVLRASGDYNPEELEEIEAALDDLHDLASLRTEHTEKLEAKLREWAIETVIAASPQPRLKKPPT